MKKTLFYLITIMVILMLASCSLFEGDVDVTETETFLNDFEDFAEAPSTDEVGGENTALVAAASEDFYNKGGAAVNFMNPLSFKDKEIASKLLFDTIYGTYEYDSLAYDFVLTDDSTPTDGYLFKWTFVDSAGTSHDAALLINELTYYSEDPDESTPTNMRVSLSLDDEELLVFEYSATYETVTDEWGDEYWPTSMEVSLEVVDEVKVTVSYNGSIVEDEDGEPTLEIDTASLRIDDYVNDEWVSYKVTSTGEETINFVMENNEGWKIDVDTEAPVEYDEDGYIYTKVDFAGELTKDGNHAADLVGVIWEPSDATHQSYMTAIFPDGSEEEIDLSGLFVFAE